MKTADSRPEDKLINSLAHDMFAAIESADDTYDEANAAAKVAMKYSSEKDKEIERITTQAVKAERKGWNEAIEAAFNAMSKYEEVFIFIHEPHKFFGMIVEEIQKLKK